MARFHFSDIDHWPFQEPKLEVPTVFKAYVFGNKDSENTWQNMATYMAKNMVRTRRSILRILKFYIELISSIDIGFCGKNKKGKSYGFFMGTSKIGKVSGEDFLLKSPQAIDIISQGPVRWPVRDPSTPAGRDLVVVGLPRPQLVTSFLDH